MATINNTSYDQLSDTQKEYFQHLAAGDPERTAEQFFEDTVPVQIQDDPAKIEVFLNGGTVTTTEYVHMRGRAGGEYVEVEHELPDRDWSHDTSRANGGTDSADNGRFEDASTNRARGSANSTLDEQAAADASNELDADLLKRGTVLEDVEEAATVTAGAEGLELLSSVAEVGVDFIAPVVGAGFAAKLVSDQFDKTEEKVMAGSVAAIATGTVLCTPIGQAGLGLYLGYKLIRRGYRFFNKQTA